MDRTIEVKVNGSYITKDNRNAGVQHEANSTSLRIQFDPSWDSYAKKITWWDAKGENPVEIILGTNLLEDAAASTRVYLCPIPGEPLAECGECTFVIDGYVDGRRQRSAADRLWVKEAPFKENAGQPSDPTPSQAEQLQKEIDGIKGTISQAVASRDAAAESAAQAKTSETAAASSAGAAGKSEAAAAGSAASAAADASAAEESAGAAARSEQNAKASETSAKSSETTASSAAAAAVQAKTAAESAQNAAETAQGKAESAQTAAEAAQGKAESAQTAAESAKTTAESSERAAAASEKSARSWAVGGTGTRVGEDTNNAKYWSDRAAAVVGGDFATKAEAQGYVDTHNQSGAAHADLRQAIAGKENAGAAAAVQQELDTHTGNAAIHITAAERAKWNAKEEGGAAAAVQQNLTAHMGDTVKHVTEAERTAWNGKADLVNGKVPSSQLPAADGFTKEETLKDATAALYGLGTGAVPDDVLAELGKYKQYWWRRRDLGHYVLQETSISAPRPIYMSYSSVVTYTYGSSVTINQTDGTVTIDNPQTLTTQRAPNESVFDPLIGSYYMCDKNMRHPNTGADVMFANTLYFIPNGATISNNGEDYYLATAAMKISTEKTAPGDWEYLQSSNRSAYPDSGTQDGYEYEYLGIPFDNAVTAPKIETGSYVGTGTYGKANPNTLTFGFVPKFVWIYGFKRNDAWYDAGDVTKVPVGIIPEGDFGRHFPPCSSTESSNTAYSKRVGTTLSWYNTGSAGNQLNYSDSTYYYIAIG